MNKRHGRFSLLAALLFAVALSATAAPLDDEAMIKRLAACASCHGTHGEGASGSEYYPHLAGKPAGYLLAQMQGFRDGRRHYPQMVYLMNNWDDAWLRDVADFYARLPVMPPQHVLPPPLSGEAREHAEALVLKGDPSRRLPACTACHGPDLEGQEPGVPALAGLPVDYLIAQLGGWATGTRRAMAPDCMAEIVERLQPGEIRQLSTWIAGLVPEAGSAPAEAGSWPAPLDCGAAIQGGSFVGEQR